MAKIAGPTRSIPILAYRHIIHIRVNTIPRFQLWGADKETSKRQTNYVIK